MSIVVEVRFPPKKLPSPQEWQQAIVANHFAVEIYTDFDPSRHTGFLPGTYKGQPAGFEYYFDLESNDLACVSFRYSSNALEGISANLAAACLCHLTAGYLVDTEAGETIQAPSVLAWAHQVEADFQRFLPAEPAHPVKTPQTKENSAKVFNDMYIATGPIKPRKPKPSPWWKFW